MPDLLRWMAALRAAVCVDKDLHLLPSPLWFGSAEGVSDVWLWTPAGLSREQVRAAAQARWLHVREPSGPPRRARLEVLDVGDDIRAPGLVAPDGCKVWRVATVYGLPRAPKRRGGLIRGTAEDQLLADWRAGWRVPVRRIATAPNRRRCGIPAHLHKPAALLDVDLILAEPVTGPIALGALRHYGLGVFATNDAAQPPT